MKAFKKTLAVILATLMLVSSFAVNTVFAVDSANEPATTSDTTESTEGNTGVATPGWSEKRREGVLAFYISTLDDFKAFHDNAATNNYYNGKQVVLLADLDMSKANGWQWTQVAFFDGVFDGRGHTIKNLVCDKAIFNKTNSAANETSRSRVTIKNVTFEGGGVNPATPANNTAFLIFQPGNYNTVTFDNVHTNVTVNGAANTAVFVSRQNNTAVNIEIKNCTNSSTVTGTARTIGGYVAKIELPTSYLLIENSTFTGTITAGVTVSSGTSFSEGGGFIGVVSQSTVKLDGCSFTGTVSGEGVRLGGAVGGVENGTIEADNCYFGGTVKGTTATNSSVQIGGAIGIVTGTASATLEKCVSAVTIKAYTSSGGFVGRTDTNATANLTDCASFANMSAGRTYSGGFLGNLQGTATFTRCVAATKEVTTGASNYGAFFYTIKGSAAKTITMTDCYATTAICPTYFKRTDDTMHTIVGAPTVIGDSTEAKFTAANFKAVCAALATAGWVATTENVTYATTGLTVPEIMPANMAEKLGRTLADSPVDGAFWHVKDGGETFDVRFIGQITEQSAWLEKYDFVGMKITVVEKGADGDTTLINAKKYGSTEVYNVIRTDAEGVKSVAAEEGSYLFSANMRGFKKTATYEVTFVSYATYNGVDIFDYDGATTIAFVSGELVK